MRNVLVGLVAVAALTASAQAAVISVQTAASTTVMSPSELAGAPGSRVGNWTTASDLAFQNNPTNYGNTNLNDNSGVLTTMDLSLTSGSGGFTQFYNADGGLTNDAKLFSGSLDSNTSLLFGLKEIPYSSYSIRVYLAGGSERSTVVTLGGTSYYVRPIGNAMPNDGTGYVQSTNTTPFNASNFSAEAKSNYVEFAGLSGSTNSFTLNVGYAADGTSRDPISGFQVVEAVPEPASLGLLGVGALALIRRRRA